MQVVQPIGLVRHGLLANLGPSWLRMDGTTEYSRAQYPDFLTAFAADTNAAGWVLAGSTAAKFKVKRVPRGTALVASGFDGVAGTLFGADSVTLLASNLPEHDHEYSKAAPQMGQGGLLGSLIQIATGLTTSAARTGKAGVPTPTPVPIQPPSLSAHLFVYAGRPRL